MKKTIGIIAVLLLLLSIIGMCTNSNEHIDDDINNIEENNTEISYEEETENSTQDQENINKGEIETAPENTDRKEESDCLHSNTVIKNSSDATCTEDGYSGDTYCKNCNKLIKNGSKIKSYGHKTETRNKKEATCTENGYTGDIYCKNCDIVINKGSKIKATGHDTEIRNKKESTTTAEGYTGDTYCINCKTIIKSGEKIPKIEKTTSETVYITETGQKYHSRKSCPGLSRANAIYETTLEKAQKQGFTPCSKCH